MVKHRGITQHSSSWSTSISRAGVISLLARIASSGDSYVSAGFQHTCVLLSDSTIKCFGLNYYGQLGTGDQVNRGDGDSASGGMGDDLPVVDLGEGAKAVGVAAGLSHSCALLDTGRVKCWGRNNWGQLGQGDYNTRGLDAGLMGDNLPPIDLGTKENGTSPLLATSVTAGDEFTCVLLETGVVKCFGRNGEGQCGRGDLAEAVGSSPDDLGDALVPVSLGTDVIVQSISSGTAASCAVLEGGAIKCWGSNSYGGLGLGDTYSRGNQPSDMGNALPTVDLGVGATVNRVFYGRRHVCAIFNGGLVKCWGDNRSGQLGMGHVYTIGDDADEMGDNLHPIHLGDGEKAIWLAAGESHTCAILATDSQVRCWGKGFYGQLGDGHYEARGKYPGEMGDSLRTVDLETDTGVAVLAAGSDHNCAVLDNGSLKCWGFNNLGALGLGDAISRGDDSGEMGENLPAVALGTNATISLEGWEAIVTMVPTTAPSMVLPVVATGEGTVAPSAAAPASSLTLSPHASRSSSPLPSPAPMITEGATHAPQVAGPTPSPTVARASSGNALRSERAGTNGEDNDDLFEDNLMVVSLAAPLAAFALLAVVCACRRSYRTRRGATSTAVAGASLHKSEGVDASVAEVTVALAGHGEEVLGHGYGGGSSDLPGPSGGTMVSSPTANGESGTSTTGTRTTIEKTVKHDVGSTESLRLGGRGEASPYSMAPLMSSQPSKKHSRSRSLSLRSIHSDTSLSRALPSA